MKTIGEHIKEHRRAAGLTLRGLAAISGLSFAQISTYERNERFPNCMSLIALADALGVSIDELIGHEVVKK